MWYKNKKILLGLALLAIVIIFRLSGVSDFFTLEYIKMQRDWLQSSVENNYVVSALAFILLYLSCVAFSLPVGAMLSMVGGFLFGTIPGFLFALTGATIGAIILFCVVRYVIGNSLQQKYATQLESFNAAMEREGASYLLVVRFIVVIPFFVINILAALTKVPLATFIWTTMLGVAPATFIFAFAGQQLLDISSIRDVFSPRVILALVLLAMFAFLPIMIKWFSRKKQ
jgi:uncharacterized membrane protein YdjX (TVP38/TMEM64 family)